MAKATKWPNLSTLNLSKPYDMQKKIILVMKVVLSSVCQTGQIC